MARSWAAFAALLLCAPPARSLRVRRGGLTRLRMAKGFQEKKAAPAPTPLSERERNEARVYEAQTLFNWARDGGAGLAGLKPEAFGAMGVGLAAAETLSPKQIALSLPGKLCLSVNVKPSGEENPNPNPNRKVIPPSLWDNQKWDEQLATMLVYERCRGAESPLASWISSLPSTEDLAILPVNWPAARVERLGCAYTVAQVKKQKAEWTAAAEDFERQVATQMASYSDSFRTDLALKPTAAMYLWARGCVRSRAFSGPWEGSTFTERIAQAAFLSTLSLVYIAATGVENATDALQGFVAASLFLFARDILRSRKSGDAGAAAGAEVGEAGGYRRYTLAPLIDMLNHRPNPSAGSDPKAKPSGGSDVSYEYFQDRYSVVVGGVLPGEQAYISYGDYPSSALLQYYGFCLSGSGGGGGGPRAEGLSRFERVSFPQATALDWLAEAGGGILSAAAKGDAAHWRNFDINCIATRIGVLDKLKLLGYGPVSVQGRVAWGGSGAPGPAAVLESGFDPVSERVVLALVAGEADLKEAGPSLERIQKYGLGWDALEADTRKRYADVTAAAKAALAADRAGDAGAEGDAVVAAFRRAQSEFLTG